MVTIPEELRRRLEQQYHPTQTLDINNGQQLPFDDFPQQSFNNSSTSNEEDLHNHDIVGRNLPKCPVTDENMASQYAAFILYCNPTIPLYTDTRELQDIFRAPPRSDGKSFSTWALFELIKKLETKEIKTWAQLALDLGVEPPALDKGQSAQKVQQYAVRLKRWMHAMHVDAFFEYLLSKPHPYWSQVPSVSEHTPETARDGVPAEEDLAIRALLPELRPKRGRRKNEDREDGDLAKSPAQRPRVNSPTLSEDFMVARASIVPEEGTMPVLQPSQSFDDRTMPWSAMEARSHLGAFLWPPNDRVTTPLTAYPQSAITPTNRAEIWNDEPRSAVTPKSRARRKHGPAVSSAWPSSGSSSGKLRGRPPNNRSVQDGPFSTFPANPTSRDLTSNRDSTPAVTPAIADTRERHFFPTQPTTSIPASNGPPSRPGRLSLQVPQREGGEVRLATPPPVVLVNGEERSTTRPGPGEQTLDSFLKSNSDVVTSSSADPDVQLHLPEGFSANAEINKKSQGILETYFASKILAAEIITPDKGSLSRCKPIEARSIAQEIVKALREPSLPHEAFLIFLLNLSALATAPGLKGMRIVRTEKEDVTDYECTWTTGFSNLKGNFTITVGAIKDSEQVTVDGGQQGIQQDEDDDDDGISWKEKYLQLKKEVKEKEEKAEKLKRTLMEAASNL